VKKKMKVSSEMRVRARASARPVRCMCNSRDGAPRSVVSHEQFFRSLLESSSSLRSSRPLVVALGSGDLVAGFLKHISRSSDLSAEDMVFKSTSATTSQELTLLNLPVASGGVQSTVDVFVDQADQVHVMHNAQGSKVWYTIGAGSNGPQTSMTDVRAVKDTVANCPLTLVLTKSQDNGRLRGQLPVIIKGDGEGEGSWEEIAEEVDDLFVVDAEMTRRSHSAEANTRGYPDPVVTPDGNMILDILFYDGFRLFGEAVDYRTIEEEVESIEGVEACGLVGVRGDCSVTVYRLHATGVDEFEVTRQTINAH
jgi:ribose 5-phosphate isomerase